MERMKETKQRIQSRRGFTFIELLIVMSLISGLSLLAAPRYIGQVSRSHETGIRNDIMILEHTIRELHVLDQSSLVGWPSTPSTSLATYHDDDVLFNVDGLMDDSQRDWDEKTFTRLPEDFVDEELKTYLKGAFYLDDNGQVYYADVQL